MKCDKCGTELTENGFDPLDGRDGAWQPHTPERCLSAQLASMTEKLAEAEIIRDAALLDVEKADRVAVAQAVRASRYRQALAELQRTLVEPSTAEAKLAEMTKRAGDAEEIVSRVNRTELHEAYDRMKAQRDSAEAKLATAVEQNQAMRELLLDFRNRYGWMGKAGRDRVDLVLGIDPSKPARKGKAK